MLFFHRCRKPSAGPQRNLEARAVALVRALSRVRHAEMDDEWAAMCLANYCTQARELIGDTADERNNDSEAEPDRTPRRGP